MNIKSDIHHTLSKIKNRITHYIGLKFSARKDEDEKLIAAIQKRMEALSCDDISFYLQKVLLPGSDSHQEIVALAEMLVNPETYFFRDKGQFELLYRSILPKIIDKRRQSQIIRLWSAGCSTGEEAFSLAILMALLVPNWRNWKIIIIGSDINTEALKQAQKGVFSKSSFRSMNPDMFNTFFHSVNHSHWAIDSRILNLVTFCKKNLVGDPFPSPTDLRFYDMDLILCRNVFIYFTHQAILTVVNKIVDTLCEGGVLLTGHGELHGINHPLLKKIPCRESLIFQKKSLLSHQPEIPDLTDL